MITLTLLFYFVTQTQHLTAKHNKEHSSYVYVSVLSHCVISFTQLRQRNSIASLHVSSRRRRIKTALSLTKRNDGYKDGNNTGRAAVKREFSVYSAVNLGVVRLAGCLSLSLPQRWSVTGVMEDTKDLIHTGSERPSSSTAGAALTRLNPVFTRLHRHYCVPAVLYLQDDTFRLIKYNI